MRRVLVMGVALLLLAAIVSAVGWRGGHSPRSTPSAPLTTATVARTTLVQSTQVDGTVGFGPATPVVRNGSGTLTWVAAPGMTITRGHAVLRVDDGRIPLFYGSLPLYRTLTVGSRGRDVEELERNLAALDYDVGTVDRVFTPTTRGAVRAWQRANRTERTGMVTPGGVIVATGARRVAQVNVFPGSAAQGQILTWTSPQRRVEVDLDVSLQTLVHHGTTASITLPDGTTVPGTVVSIGAVTAAGAASRAPADATAQSAAAVPVVIGVAHQGALQDLDMAPVTADFRSATARDVLAVSVTALVALAGGGYGLQVVNPTGTTYVRVRPGLFAHGLVQVSGDGLNAGMRVVVPHG